MSDFTYSGLCDCCDEYGRLKEIRGKNFMNDYAVYLCVKCNEKNKEYMNKIEAQKDTNE